MLRYDTTLCYDGTMMKRTYSIAIAIKGFSGIVAQTLLFRELLVLFGGNELTIALMLATWLLSGAMGSRFFARIFDDDPKSLKPYGTLLLLSGLTLPLAIIVLRASKTILGVPPGEIFTLGQIVFVCALGLALPALCDGALFALGIRLMPSVGKIYFFEACGIITGGVAFTVFLLSFANAFQIALMVTILNLACRALLLPNKNARHWHHQTSWILTAAILVIWPLASKANSWSLGIQWPEKNIAIDANSFYGRITLTQEKNQWTLFYDGLPTLSIPDPEMFLTEDFIHLPMLTKPRAKKILFIGNATGGFLRELLKYPVTSVTVVANDPLLIKILTETKDPLISSELKDPRVHVELTDARRFIRSGAGRYDAIFVNAGPPISLAANRFYTREFFLGLDKALDPAGFAVFKTPGSLSFLSPEQKNINASLIKTLSSVFPRVAAIPGDAFNIVMASQKEIPFDPYRMNRDYDAFKITTSLINPAYLQLRLDKAYQSWFRGSIHSSLAAARVNTDIQPSGLYAGLSLAYAEFSKKIPRFFDGLRKIKTRPLVIALTAAFLLWRRHTRNKKNYAAALNVTLLTTGFYAMAIQVIILCLFQSCWGSLYGWLALLTAIFMAGAAAGAKAAGHTSSPRVHNGLKTLWIAEVFLPASTSLFLLAVAFFFEKLNQAPAILVLCFFLASGTAGFLAGWELSFIAEIKKTKEKIFPHELSSMAGRLYGWDLLGACLGCMAVPLLFVPNCGIAASILILLFIKSANGWCLAGLKK